MEDFTKGIKKAISNLSRAAEKCVNEYQDFEKQIEYANRKYQYECPECGKIMRFESEVTIIRCDKCDHVFNIEIQRAIKETMDLAKCDDWKILDVNCLKPDDILTGNYDFQWISTGGTTVTAYGKNASINNRLDFLKNRFVKYRPIPTKKTHEELAEEWLNNNFPGTSSRGVAITAFIAGRKSMESES